MYAFQSCIRRVLSLFLCVAVLAGCSQSDQSVGYPISNPTGAFISMNTGTTTWKYEENRLAGFIRQVNFQKEQQAGTTATWQHVVIGHTAVRDGLEAIDSADRVEIAFMRVLPASGEKSYRETIRTGDIPFYTATGEREESVEIIWTDAQGKQYRTSAGDQSGSRFTVTSHELLAETPGRREYLTKGTFSCLLHDEWGYIMIQSGEFVLYTLAPYE